MILTQPKRFGLDISDYMAAVRVAENIDFSRRYKLYDLYEDILMDTHLSCVLEKRKNAVLCSNMEFRVDGKPDDKISNRYSRPGSTGWWVTSLMRNSGASRSASSTSCRSGWMMTVVPRKHVVRVRELYPAPPDGHYRPFLNEYTDLLFVGSPSTGCGQAAPWVIYKRNTTGDGHSSPRYSGMTTSHASGPWRMRPMPEAGDFFHVKDTELKLTEAGKSKTGSADVYERLCERCNNEISKLIRAIR